MTVGRALSGLPLSVQGLGRTFGGVTALQDVTLEVPAGARHAVIGPNGAGKSTLLRVIGGELAPSSGGVRVGERSIAGLGAEGVAALGVARSFQTSSLFPEDSVLDNVLLAALAHRPQRRGLWRALGEHPEAVARARGALARMGLLAQAHARAGALSHGEARQLELAMVIAQEPSILLLDEPLAGLSAPERGQVAALLQGLPRGLTIVLIEHDLPFCLAFANRITVLSNGRSLATGTPAEIRADPAVQAVYLGSAPARTERGPGGRRDGAAPALAVRELRAGYGQALALDGVSLEVFPGEIVAVLGRNGMGKTTLLTTLMGWRPPSGGTVTLAGRPTAGLGPAELSRRGLALVPQGRRVMAGLTVDEELRLSARPGGWTPERIYQIFPPLAQRRRTLSTTLSGGEQQMLAIGRALLQNPQVLLLDEPSEGLSPQVVDVVRDLLLSLRGSGETVVIAEQNLDLALAVADRVYVLEHGRVVFDGDTAHLEEHPALVRELLGV